MTKEQLKAFLEKVNADTELQKKLMEASGPDAFAAIAKDAGYDVDKFDFLGNEDSQSTELNDLDLERVAGGGMEGTLCILGGIIGTVASLAYTVGKKNGS
jgi:predicted ribosomally synthesized peptide with nif11-like leader